MEYKYVDHIDLLDYEYESEEEVPEPSPWPSSSSSPSPPPPSPLEEKEAGAGGAAAVLDQVEHKKVQPIPKEVHCTSVATAAQEDVQEETKQVNKSINKSKPKYLQFRLRGLFGTFSHIKNGLFSLKFLPL